MKTFFILSLCISVALAARQYNAPKVLIFDNEAGVITDWRGQDAVNDEIDISKVETANFEHVSTVILHGSDAVSAKTADHAPAVFTALKSVEEIVAVGPLHENYFESLQSSKARHRVKFLMLYQYSGSSLNDPCRTFPKLEELAIVQSDMAKIKLATCKRNNLASLWVRGGTPRSPTNAVPDLYRSVELMKKIGSLLHSERSKSLKAYAWDQIDRTYFYKDAQDAMDMEYTTTLNYGEIAQALGQHMKFLEVSPCNQEMLWEVAGRVDRMNTVLYLGFGKHAVVGSILRHYMHIYEMATPPSDVLYSVALPKTNQVFGIRFDDGAMTSEWRNLFKEYTQMNHLRVDAQVGMIDTLTGGEILFSTVFQNVKKVTFTLTGRDVRDKFFGSTLMRDVPIFLKTLRRKLKIIMLEANKVYPLPQCKCDDQGTIYRPHRIVYECEYQPPAP